MGVEYDQGRRDRRKEGENKERTGVWTFSGEGGGNGALTVLHSGSSISITLWVTV